MEVNKPVEKGKKKDDRCYVCCENIQLRYIARDCGVCSTCDASLGALVLVGFGMREAATMMRKKVRKRARQRSVSLRCAARMVNDRLGGEFRKQVEARKERMRFVRRCRGCGEPLSLKEGKYGPFWACPNWPTCQAKNS